MAKKFLKIENYKNFKKGDLIIISDHRNGIDGRPSEMWVCHYDHDIDDLDEAVKLHYENMKRTFPNMDISIEMVKETMDDAKYFVSEEGDVRSYDNHERADIFDLRYFNGEDWDKLYQEKEKFVSDHNILRFEDFHSRVYPEMLNQ